MKLSEPLEKAFRRLFDHYTRLDEERGRQVKSLQAPFEAQMEAKAKIGGHKPIIVRTRDGHVAEHKGTDIGCGCDAHHRHGGDHSSAAGRLPFYVVEQPQLSRADAVGTALRRIKARDPGAAALLERLATVPLSEPWRAFGTPFKSDGGERALQRAPLLGVAQEPARGYAVLVEATPTAVAEWGDDARRRCLALGAKIQHIDPGTYRYLPGRLEATSRDHALARTLREEARQKGEELLRTLADAMATVERLPAAVTRAGPRRASRAVRDGRAQTVRA